MKQSGEKNKCAKSHRAQYISQLHVFQAQVSSVFHPERQVLPVVTVVERQTRELGAPVFGRTVSLLVSGIKPPSKKEPIERLGHILRAALFYAFLRIAS